MTRTYMLASESWHSIKPQKNVSHSRQAATHFSFTQNCIKWVPAQRSGLSQSEYCKQHNVDAAKLSYYRGRFKLKQQLANANNAEFKAVKITQPTQNEVIKLSLPNGFHCEFSSRIDVMQVKKLSEKNILQSDLFDEPGIELIGESSLNAYTIHTATHYYKYG